MPVSQNGYPVVDSGSSLLHDWVIPFKSGSHITLRMRNGSCGLLLCVFILWFHERIEPIVHSIRDYWGHNKRLIGDGPEWSNHASGTAADILATKYPQGTRHMSASTKRRITRRLTFMRGTLAHGAFWNNVDEMHVEIAKDIAACERAAKFFIKFGRGRRIILANPGQRKVIYS